MNQVERDEERQERIRDEAIVDAYGPEEQAMGWYYYLADKISFPFQARCRQERSISPLKQGEKVQVVGMAPEDECMREIFVSVRWMQRTVAVPLAQLEALQVDEETIGDWHYWVARGYELM